MWEIKLAPQAVKDAAKLKNAKLADKAKELLAVIRSNPFQNPPPYEKLQGYHPPRYSRRINKQHRLVYQVYTEAKRIEVLRMWTHYE